MRSLFQARQPQLPGLKAVRPGGISTAIGLIGLIGLLVGGLRPGIATAAEAPFSPPAKRAAHAPPFTIWDVVLSGSITEIPARDVAEIACGTNGGPPSRPLAAITDFRACPPEDDGLREIYFSYDDEFEYRAKALELPTEAALHAGTTVAGHPVIVSVLADDSGRLRGLRVITDSRAEVRERRRAASLGAILKSRFGDGWACRDLAPRDGEEPVGGVFINRTCEKSDPVHGRLVLSTRYLRKKGQHGRSPVTGRPVKGAYESYTRLEQRKP